MPRFGTTATVTSQMAAFGICGRRHIAGLRPAADAFAEPPRKSGVAARRPFVGRRQLYRADGWSISSWFGGDNPAFGSSGNPSDSGGSDGGGGDGGGD